MASYKVTANRFCIDIRKSDANIIRQLLALREKKHNGEVLYKKSKTAFEKAYKMPLDNAPIVFSDGDTIWKLSHSIYLSGGREHEDIAYLPIISAKGKFAESLAKNRFF